jgi:general secretion pathway protein G
MKKAFTLVELMIVIVVIGILAGFGAANFSKSLGKAKARDAINNLTIIHAANMMYKARNGNNCTTDSVCATIAGINSMNGANSLNIIAGSTTYTCANSGTTCTATGTNFTITANLDGAIVQGTNPGCTGSHCP